MKFDPLNKDFSIAEAEKNVLDYWKEHDVFTASLKAAEGKKPFVFYEGPPTANGKPGIHHVLARTIKDIICRYRALTGWRVDRKAGWDTHGLPVEIEVEKQLGLEGREQVEEYGIEKYNAACRESVLKYKGLWDDLTVRMGYWVDLDKPYITFTNDYIESVWWLLKQMYDKGLLYKSYKIQWYSPGSNTVLSSHEVSLGYKEVQDPSVYIRFKEKGEANTYFLAWTTTPWTLISNAALAVGPKLEYVKIELTSGDNEGQFLILGRDRLLVIEEEYEVVESYKGSDLAGRFYEPLFDYFVGQDGTGNAWQVYTADYVTTDDGTGIVHTAPAFGAEDFDTGKKYDLPVLNPVLPDGHFSDEAELVAGDWFKDADKKVVRDLRDRGLLYRQETYLHNYPHDWRKGTPLISYPIEGWFVRTTELKERMIELNRTINWKPESIGSGRFGEWLENNVDWALSRRRYWGTPLPIWQSDKEGSDYVEVIGSVAELREKTGDAVAPDDDLDLHRPFVDNITWPAPDGGTMRRVKDLIDVWFDSGAMPFAQWHYPFENKEIFEKNFPAHFIAEGLDQTRGWFYTLHAIATIVKDSVAYKNIIVNGLLLDDKGEKMSKSKGNVVDPFTTIDQYGADPVRWYMMAQSAPWLPLKFDMADLAEVMRKYFDTLRNTYSFFAIYANIDQVLERAEKDGKNIEAWLLEKAGEPTRFDRWIISKYNSLIQVVRESFEDYEITRPVRAIQQFVIDELSNWYVRNNRRRFWAEGDDPSKMRAFYTLHHVLVGVCQLASPVSPMISELLWRELVGKHRKDSPLSVHMLDYPEADDEFIDRELEEVMDRAERIVSLGRAARSRHNLKVRQPLAALQVRVPKKETFDKLGQLADVIRDELNVKEIEYADNLDSLVTFEAKLNFKQAGPLLGKRAKAAGAWAQQLDSETVRKFARSKEITFDVDGPSIILTDEHIEVIRNEVAGFAVESDGEVTVALTTELTDELIDEGFAREIVNKIQNMRKTTGLEVTDNIAVQVASTERLKSAATKHDDFIRRETLATRIEFVTPDSLAGGTEWNINGEKTSIAVTKV